jgi:hypothetical protein
VSIWWARVALAACVPVAVAAAVNGYADIQGFDTYGYHLPLAVRWWKHGALLTGPEEVMNTFYPGNFELMLRWLVALGTDRLAYLASFASGVVCVVAINGIARAIGQPKTIARISALSSVSLAVLVFQSTIAYSDTFVAAMLLTGVWLLTRWTRGRGNDTRLIVGLGLSLGLAAGAKYSALPMAIVIALVWGWLMVRHAYRLDKFGEATFNARWATGQVLSFALPFLVCSLYWYLRNAVEHGNPTFPVALVGLRGSALTSLIAVPSEVASAGWRVWLYPWRELGYNEGAEHGLGPVFAAVALVGFVLVPFVRTMPRRPLRTLVWVITLGAYVVWLRTGMLIPRYGLFPLLMTFVFVGELWMACESHVLKVITIAATAISGLVLTRGLLVGAMYVALVGARRTGVPDAIDRLPPTRILNAAGQPAGYYALGRDYRHEVITLYRDAMPNDVGRLGARYLLVPSERSAAFRSVLDLELVARWAGPGLPSTELWRVR